MNTYTIFNHTSNIKDTYSIIEKDIINNQTQIFNMYNYYTKKYRGSRLIDVNVGLFYNEENKPTVQIFVRNKTGYIKTHTVFNREGNKINYTKTLNTTY